MNQRCRECGGTSLSVSRGVKICDQCGTERKGYVELLSQEFVTEVEHSRLTRSMVEDDDEDDNEAADDVQKEEQPNNWTTYDAYNVVLHEWTKALCSLGASTRFQKTVFKLWVAYLHCIEIAFIPQNWRGNSNPKFTVNPNKRDVHLIHRMHRSVSYQDLAFQRPKKKISKRMSKLEKLKNKFERKRFKQRQGSDSCPSVMSNTCSLEMSRSLTELETSSFFSDLSRDLSTHHEDSTSPEKLENISDVSSVSSHHSKVQAKKQKLSIPDDGTWYDSNMKCSESESEPLPKKQIKAKCNKFVRKWLENKTNIYGTEEENSSNGEEVREESKIDSSISGSLKETLFTDRSRTSTLKKKDFRRKLQRKALQLSEGQKFWLYSKQPIHMTFEKLLGLLYLAVLLAKEEFFLMDIIRWCREGHIPYMSAHYLLKPNMKLFLRDLQMLRNVHSVPTANQVQDVAGRLALFLSIQFIPLPAVGDAIFRLVKVLRLPESVGTFAKSIVKLKKKITVSECIRIPAVESLAMASIIVVLKAFCGINDNYEIRLSQAASKINADLLTSGITAPLFSWDEWERYICCLIWFCTQVDPVSALNCQQFKQLVRMESSQFSKFFWSEALWRTPQTTLKQNKTLSLITKKFLDYQGESLEKVLNQPSVFKATLQPFMSIVEQFLEQHRGDEQQSVQKLVKIAEELVTKSFYFHTLEWTCRLETLQKDLQKCNSNISVLPEVVIKQNESGTNRNCFKIVKMPFHKHEPEGKQNNQKSTLIIPQPLKNIWESPDRKFTNWNNFSSSLPDSFKWLIKLGSLVCETKEKQIYSCIKMLEKRTNKLWQ